MPALNRWLTKKVVMPRWAIGLDFLWRTFLAVGAITVVILWYQSATRDEEADRNARVQTCSSEYASTYSAWDAEGQRLFGELISFAANNEPIDAVTLGEYRVAVANTAEMARRRIGLATFSADSIEGGAAFACPSLPDELVVEGIPPNT